MKFYICNHCKNIIGKIQDKGVPVVCCGEKMAELVPNTTEAATEKHIPVPMTEEHLIQWVYLETEEGGQRKSLKAGDKPEVVFALSPSDKAKAVYAYCNLHGLWKADL